MLREISDPTGYAWINSETGGVLMWNRYTRTFRFAINNEPRTERIRILDKPWIDGASNIVQAREMAELFFYGWSKDV